jgi:hypothetical protein
MADMWCTDTGTADQSTENDDAAAAAAARAAAARAARAAEQPTSDDDGDDISTRRTGSTSTLSVLVDIGTCDACMARCCVSCNNCKAACYSDGCEEYGRA